MNRTLILLLLVTLLAACSGSPQGAGVPPPVSVVPTAAPGSITAEPDTADQQITISFAAWDYERQIYEPLARKFMDQHPTINVVLVPLDDLTSNADPNADYGPLAQLRRIVSGADTALALGLPAEVFGSGLVLDLKPQMEADASFQADDFLPGALDHYTFKNGTWLLPRSLTVQLLSYNQELFKQANLPEPKPGWTWSDLLGAAEQLANRNGTRVATYGYLDGTVGYLPLLALLEQQGIDLLRTPPEQIELDRPEVVRAAERVRTLVDSGALFHPQYKTGPDDPNFADPMQLVRDGRVAVWGAELFAIDGPAGNPGSGGPGDDFPAGKVPYPNNRAAFAASNEGYIISAGTRHPKEAWQWIEFLTRQPIEQAQPGIPSPGRIPARLSLAEQTDFWQHMDEQTAAAYKWAIAHPPPRFDRMPDGALVGALAQALNQILMEQEEAQQALRDAQRQFAQQLAEVQLTPTMAPTVGPVIVATPAPQLAPGGAATVTFSAYGANPSDLRRLARAFNAQHPELFVQINLPEHFATSPSLAQIAQTSDCFGWPTLPQREDDVGALLDLRPLFDADASFPIADYWPALLSLYEHNGRLLGVPYAAMVRTLNYNKTAFDVAGIAPPTHQWTPDDFLAAAQALTTGAGANKQYGYVPLNGAHQDIQFFVGQFGGQLTIGSGAEIRPTFTNPKTVAALQWYLDLASVHQVMPPLRLPYKPGEMGGQDKAYEYVQGGRAGMWFDQGYGIVGPPAVPGKGDGPGRPALSFEVGLAPLPIGAGGLRGGDLHLRGFHISAQTQQAQGCWEWIKFLSGDLSNLYGSIPARRSVLESEAFKQQATPDMLALAETYAVALAQDGRQSSTSGDVKGFEALDLYWFYKALSEAIAGTTPLEQGLAEAQQFSSAFMECLAENPNRPASCAKQVDPTYQGFNTQDP